MAGASAAPAPGPGRLEWATLALLCAWLAVAWGLQYHPFLLPNNDWYSFGRAARDLGAGHVPDDLKRMPLFPLLVGLGAKLLPGPHPYLHAALLWNLAFALGALVLVFVLAARAFGAGAVLVPALWAAAPQLHAMALQPLVEPSLGFSVLLAVVLFQARSPWQYAAAWAAGLGRYEAALLVPVLWAANLAEGGRPVRHTLLAAAAASGALGWAALGALRGAGGGTSYLALMEGMGFQLAMGFAARVVEEAFAGLHPLAGALGWPAFTLVVGVPALVGVAAGLREFRRETLVILAFGAATTAAVIVFGIDKARYVYAGQWIPLLFWALGMLRLTGGLADALGGRPPRGGWWALAVAAGVGVAGAFAAGLAYLATRPRSAPLALDAAHAAVVLAAAAVAFHSVLAGGRPASRLPRTALAAAALVAVALLASAGTARKAIELFGIANANYGSWRLAGWASGNLGPQGGLVVFHRSHVLHLTDLPRRRVEDFGDIDAESPEVLARVMRERGLDHVAYTWRAEADDPAERYYNRRANVDLAEHFRDGEPVPGFEHVATLPVPPEVGESPVQVYRLSAGSAVPPASGALRGDEPAP